MTTRTPAEQIADAGWIAALASDFDPKPLNWREVQESGEAPINYLDEPYLPASARTLAVGPAESAKSLWALWKAGQLTLRGLGVVYISQENPLNEDVRRLSRIPHEPERLKFFNNEGIDLANEDHVTWLVGAAAECSLVVIDTLTACWSGDEESNKAITELDRNVHSRLMREAEVAILTIGHVGHVSVTSPRRGVSAPRGASSKGQTTDSLLVFHSRRDREFTIEHHKSRVGGRKAEKQSFRIEDTEDGLIDIRETAASNEAVERLADKMVAAITSHGELNTRKLREVVKGSKELQVKAMALLAAEFPPRVAVTEEPVQTNRGPQAGKVWRLSEGYPQAIPDTLGEPGKGGPRVVSIGHPGPPYPPSAEGGTT